MGGDIEQEWFAVGPDNVGYAVSDELHTADDGRFQVFERPAPALGNSIYWRSDLGAHQIGGVIRDKWRDWGWETGTLGYPITRETSTPNNTGRYNTMENGSIYWSDSTGANEIGGAIRDKWAQLGWEAGALGFPTTDEVSVDRNNGKFNHFQGGSIYWSSATGAHPVWGAIRDQWEAAGWENSSYGFPTSDEYDYNGGKRQDFEGGSITWPASYDRAKAVAYAEQWWDGFNTDQYPMFGDDCTSFASQALHEGGLEWRGTPSIAAMEDANNWFGVEGQVGQTGARYWTHSFSVAPDLRQWLLTHNSNSGNGTIATDLGSVTSISDKSSVNVPAAMQPGDVMFYDWTDDGVIDHASFFVGDYDTELPPSGDQSAIAGSVDGHTNARQHSFWSMWKGNDDWKSTRVYFVHINDGVS
ncbi:amidase domain-containing protein [Rhodococcus sp. IEGM1428]|uniref:amidase domain-containing protein n=1 Tax=Rhodococcus sp. IEGM1428 TaxID=3392191 RepID=UPI003D1217AC